MPFTLSCVGVPHLWQGSPSVFVALPGPSLIKFCTSLRIASSWRSIRFEFAENGDALCNHIGQSVALLWLVAHDFL
jgi:hypothetical protein